MRKFLVLVILAGLALAGCTDDDDGRSDGTITFADYTRTDEVGRIIASNPADWVSCAGPVVNPDLPPVDYGPIPAFPNATNGVCLVGFKLPATREVTLSIWQVGGKSLRLLDPAEDILVATITTGPHAAGRHLRFWDGKDALGNRLPPGTYLCRMETPDCLSTGEIRIITCPYDTERLLSPALIEFLDTHWSLEKLAAAFDPGYLGRPGANPAYASIVGVGSNYFPFVEPGQGPEALPLYVAREADLSLFVENIAMWNQFVFGWDDFVDPRAWDDSIDPNSLSDRRTSAQREVFRGR